MSLTASFSNSSEHFGGVITELKSSLVEDFLHAENRGEYAEIAEKFSVDLRASLSLSVTNKLSMKEID